MRQGDIGRDAPIARLDAGRRSAAMLLRGWPRSIRKFDYIWERAYRRLGGGGFDEAPEIDNAWPEGLQPPITGRTHPFKMRLELRDWAQRRYYFSGEYYQRDIVRLLRAAVGPNDVVVDIGANIGMISLLCARLVGRMGAVHAFEANPATAARLEDHIRLNSLTGRVALYKTALGDRPGVATLSLPGARSGLGTLTLAGAGGVEVPVARADDILPEIAPGPVMVKIDVEGYEQRALSGCANLLARPDVAIVAEVSPEWLARVGDSAGSLYAFLADFAFVPYRFAMEVGRWGARLNVLPAPTPPDEKRQHDVLFLKKNSTAFNRLWQAGLLPG